MLLSKTSALTTEQIRWKKPEVLVARPYLPKKMHGREDFETRLGRMYQNIDALGVEDEMDTEDGEIWENRGDICSLEKAEFL